MTCVLVLRPEPGARATLDRALAMGLEARSCPLFEIEGLPWQPVEEDAWDALLLGSANALRHAGPSVTRWRGRPAYAVGQTTARAAREAGLDVVACGEGGLQNMLGMLAPAHRRLLRLAGTERIVLNYPENVQIITREVYTTRIAATARDMADVMTSAPGGQVIALLHSAQAAARFVALCDAIDADRSRIAIAAIGPRVTRRVMEIAGGGNGWAACASAPRPSDAELLALAQRMCQDERSGLQDPFP